MEPSDPMTLSSMPLGALIHYLYSAGQHLKSLRTITRFGTMWIDLKEAQNIANEYDATDTQSTPPCKPPEIGSDTKSEHSCGRAIEGKRWRSVPRTFDNHTEPNHSTTNPFKIMNQFGDSEVRKSKSEIERLPSGK